MPLQAGVDAIPPNALGSFISSIHGVTDRSAGARMVFKVEDFHTILCISDTLGRSRQFQRIGVSVAQRLGVPPEDTLVKFVALTSLREVEQDLGNFNKAN